MFLYRNNINRVCYVGTVYSLLLYLLYSSLVEIKHTYFIFAYGIPDDICKRFDHYCIINDCQMRAKSPLFSFLEKFWKTRWITEIPIKVLIFFNAGIKYKLFAQDHLYFSTAVIGNHDYTLIEDSAQIFTNVNNGNFYQSTWNKRNNKRFRFLKLIYGETLFGIFGKNKCCKEVLLSEDDKHESIKNKTKHICNIYDSWNSSSEEKKKYINYIYDLNENDLVSLSRNNVLFSQCFYPDIMSVKEHVSIYKNVLSHYSSNEIIIKTHPRDVLDYKYFFPNYEVFDKIVPAQLLSLNGLIYKNIVTVCSTSVANIRHSGDIIWYGTEINQTTFKRLGHIEPPEGAISQIKYT